MSCISFPARHFGNCGNSSLITAWIAGLTDDTEANEISMRQAVRIADAVMLAQRNHRPTIQHCRTAPKIPHESLYGDG